MLFQWKHSPRSVHHKNKNDQIKPNQTRTHVHICESKHKLTVVLRTIPSPEWSFGAVKFKQTNSVANRVKAGYAYAMPRMETEDKGRRSTVQPETRVHMQSYSILFFDDIFLLGSRMHPQTDHHKKKEQNTKVWVADGVKLITESNLQSVCNPKVQLLGITIGVCCIQEIRLQDSNSFIRLTV